MPTHGTDFQSKLQTNKHAKADEAMFGNQTTEFYFFYVCRAVIEELSDIEGYLTQLPNICVFPGVFFIPYILFLFACGIPLFLLETALGQYTKQGSITCWKKICPLFEGKRYTHVKCNYPVCSW